LVRHGENPANLTKEFSCRRVDYPLTEKGRLQARQTGEFLSRWSVDEIWSSPLLRARETAAEIAPSLGLGVQVLEGLREMDVGDLEGMTPLLEAWGVYAQVMRHWLSGEFDYRFPAGESRRELVHRFRSALETVSLGKRDKTLVVVGHGGIFSHGIAALCGHQVEVADQKAFFSRENYNCSISTVEDRPEAGDRRFTLVDWASVGHLSGEAAALVESVPESSRIKNLG